MVRSRQRVRAKRGPMINSAAPRTTRPRCCHPSRRRCRPPQDEDRGLHPAHLADDLPFLRRYRLNRQPRIFYQRHFAQSLVGLDRGHCHRRLQGLVGFDIDANKLAGLVGRIGIGLLDDFRDPDNLLALVGVIEKGAVAFLHVHEILPRGEIAHAGPGFALGAFCHLLVPGPARGLGFHQPVCHGHPSALNGRVSRLSIAASIVIAPLIIAATAFDTGISTCCEAASSISTGAVNSPSANLSRGGGSPRPRAMPSAKLRDCGLEQVRIRSPRPASPAMGSLRAPQARPSRVSSEKPRVVRAACADAPNFLPTAIPAALASTFFSAPPSSTPPTSVV